MVVLVGAFQATGRIGYKMNAVWSFWSEPFKRQEGSTWLNQFGFLLSWVLSFETAGKHYRTRSLITDDIGARILVDQLKLTFDSVYTPLNELRHHDPSWWALGKLYTYRIQNKPFVHIDNDVFLWKRLPKEVELAPVFAQSPEHFAPHARESAYPLWDVEHHLLSLNGWLPVEWLWYHHQQNPILTASCCGIVGGQDLEFFARYADLGIRIVEDPQNSNVWSSWGNKGVCNVLIEQYLLNAYFEYHKRSAQLSNNIKIQYLFDSDYYPYVPDNAQRLGYTHLIGNAKRNKSVINDMQNLVRHEYPKYYKLCESLSYLLAKMYR
jgi:hypothetical protein